MATIYDEMIQDALRWAGTVGIAIPVIWYRGQPRAEWSRPGVTSAVRALFRRTNGPDTSRPRAPWVARVVELDLGPITVPALAVSLEPPDVAAFLKAISK